MYRRQNRKLKDAEVALSEVNVEKGRIEAKKEETVRLLMQIDHQQSTIDKMIRHNDELVKNYGEREDKYQDELKEWSDRYSEQTKRVVKLNSDVISGHEREKELILKNSRLEKERDYYELWKCYREHNGLEDGCDRRYPPQPVPLKHIPLAEVCEKCPVKECIARIEANEDNKTDNT